MVQYLECAPPFAHATPTRGRAGGAGSCRRARPPGGEYIRRSRTRVVAARANSDIVFAWHQTRACGAGRVARTALAATREQLPPDAVPAPCSTLLAMRSSRRS